MQLTVLASRTHAGEALAVQVMQQSSIQAELQVLPTTKLAGQTIYVCRKILIKDKWI